MTYSLLSVRLSKVWNSLPDKTLDGNSCENLSLASFLPLSRLQLGVLSFVQMFYPYRSFKHGNRWRHIASCIEYLMPTCVILLFILPSDMLKKISCFVGRFQCDLLISWYRVTFFSHPLTAQYLTKIGRACLISVRLLSLSVGRWQLSMISGCVRADSCQTCRPADKKRCLRAANRCITAPVSVTLYW